MKRIVCLLLCILTVAVCCIPVSAADPVVTNMDVQCIVDRNGDYEMTVTAELLFDGNSGKVSIPVGENVRNVRVPGYRVSRETVDDCTWLVLRGGDSLVGTRTFVISYKRANNVSVNDDGTQTLSLELVCPFWDWEIQNFSYTITLPAEFTAKPVFRSGYVGDDIPVVFVSSGQTIEGTVQGSLLDLESVTAEIVLPKGYFRTAHLQGGTSGVVTILMAILAGAALLYWFFLLRNPMLRLRERKALPDGVSAWEIPYVGGSGKPDPVLLITEWANLGYLTIHTNQFGRVTLKKRIPMSNERKTYECNAFEALFFRSNECPGDTPRCRKLCLLAAKGSRVYWNKRLFSARSGNVAVVEILAAVAFALLWFLAVDYILPPWLLRIILMLPAPILGFPAARILQKGIHAVLQREPNFRLAPAAGILAVTLVMTILGNTWGVTLLILAMQVLAVMAGARGGRRTADGMERIAQIKAFRNYLNSLNPHQLQLLLNRNNQYFYDMLPYAEALGIGKKFAKKFAHIRLEPCAWLNEGRNPSQTAANFYDDYRRLMRKMRGKAGLD